MEGRERREFSPFKLQESHRTYVIAASSKANIDFVKQLGADEVIDYRERRFEEAGVVDDNRAREFMISDNRPPEIRAVCAEQIGIALALFRAAVSGETAEEAILPLSDHGIRMALLEADALQRVIGVIRIHFESSDRIHPVVQRVVCFLKLLKEQNQNPHPLWSALVTYHNRFLPVVDAISWCPAYRGEAFDIVQFSKIAAHMANRVNGRS
jgi:hypothetical protein